MAAVEDAVAGTLLGTAVGDALGLPREGLSRRRARRIFGSRPLRHALLPGLGMVSDDTEHACMTAQALLAAPEVPEDFSRSLARRLRWWLLGLPAGTGWATLRATIRLWLGVAPAHSGVASAGNGPAMRAPILGVCLRHEPDRMHHYVAASTRITHRHPLADDGARAVALAAAYAADHDPQSLDPGEALSRVGEPLSEPLFLGRLEQVASALSAGATAAELAAALGLDEGVSGFIADTVPVALFCWLRWPGDFRRAMEEVILLGGDTDSTAALVGALAGTTVGASAIPEDWLTGLVDWPLSVSWMRALARRLADEQEHGPVPFCWPGKLARNVLFTAVVLGHGLRRLLPPY